MIRKMTHELSGNEYTKHSNRSNNKKYCKKQRSHIRSKYKPPLKEKYLQNK